MTTRRSKKIKKQRGSRTYGYGRVSGGHRKSGSRGGVGKAGSKGHHRIGKISAIIESQKGFSPPKRLPSRTINVGIIEEQLESWLSSNQAVKDGQAIKVDVTQLGYSKVLGSGRVNTPIHLYTSKITSRAQTKIEAVGGKIFTKDTEG
ncbi:MAG: uL15 family ribosomal protein [Candidatus Heimdallarchaeota archaeon]